MTWLDKLQRNPVDHLRAVALAHVVNDQNVSPLTRAVASVELQGLVQPYINMEKTVRVSTPHSEEKPQYKWVQGARVLVKR